MPVVPCSEIRPTLAPSCASGFLGARLFVCLTFGHNGAAKAVAQIVGKFAELRVAVDLDGLLGGVADNVAVVAPSQMVFQFGLGAVVKDAVQVVGQFLQKLRTLHCLPSPLSRFWK